MVASYIAKIEGITTIPLKERRTVTADWYVHQCFPQVLHAVRTRRPKCGITLHHDNAPAHTAAATREFLAREGVQLMFHPPCSPNLATCDFFLFPHAKKQLRGTRYDIIQGAIRAFTRAVDNVDSHVVWRVEELVSGHGPLHRSSGRILWKVGMNGRQVRVSAFLWLRTFRLTLVCCDGWVRLWHDDGVNEQTSSLSISHSPLSITSLGLADDFSLFFPISHLFMVAHTHHRTVLQNGSHYAAGGIQVHFCHYKFYKVFSLVSLTDKL